MVNIIMTLRSVIGICILDGTARLHVGRQLSNLVDEVQTLTCPICHPTESVHLISTGGLRSSQLSL